MGIYILSVMILKLNFSDSHLEFATTDLFLNCRKSRMGRILLPDVFQILIIFLVSSNPKENGK